MPPLPLSKYISALIGANTGSRATQLIIDRILNYFSITNNSGNGYAIAVDSAGAAFITGTVQDAFLNPTPGAYQETYGGQFDAFVTKINPQGTAALYSTYCEYRQRFGP